MVRRLIPIFIICCLFTATSAHSIESVRVTVLPFDIYAPGDMAYLSEEIASAFRKSLSGEGAEILDTGSLPSGAFSMENMDGIRKVGMDLGADFVVWGSFTRLGEAFSLDVKVLETFGKGIPQALSMEGGGIEQLSATVSALSERLGQFIFKRELVAGIVVAGNVRIESEAIKRVIKTKRGDTFTAKNISEDVHSIYNMGYFDNIRVDAEDGDGGKILTYRVKEKPTIRNIMYRGNSVYDEEKLQENMSIKTGAILNATVLSQNIKRIETLYHEKNYNNVHVAYEVIPIENEQADLEFIITEGKKTWIREISFEGNNTLKEKKLKKVMKTAVKGFFSWLTSSGELNEEDLDQDIDRLTAHYHNHGFIKVKISDPEVQFLEDGIHIHIKIDEGPQYSVGSVDVSGDIASTKEELLNKVDIGKDAIFSRQTLQKDVLLLRDVYADLGYAYAKVSPQTHTDDENLRVDITYDISQGPKVHFEKIIIEGNHITRDRVIRRELGLSEQEEYNGARLKKGMRRLHRLEYFEDIKVDTQRGSTDDSMILKVAVTEKPTGQFSFGGGYNTDTKFFIMGSILQRNLFGRGQTLELKGQLGGEDSQYNLIFTEPWFLGYRLSFSMNFFSWETEYNDYDKYSYGAVAKFSYPIWEDIRATLAYTYQNTEVKNIDQDASKTIWELDGENLTSSVQLGVKMDTRDHIYTPSSGTLSSASVEYAGLGGDIEFTKYLAESGWYFPFLLGTVFSVHGEVGYVTAHSEGLLPDYEKFYLGGLRSLRGFDYQDIHVLDEDGAEVGGEKMALVNLEFIFPIAKNAGLSGVIFYDTGNVYAEDESIDITKFRETAGLGVRWMSPFGPIRFEYGFILDRQEGEQSGGLEFGMGAVF